MKMLREELSDGNTSREELSEERKEYMDYIYDMLVDSEIVSSSLVDENDDVYKDWEEGSISPKEFLQYAVNSGWVISPLWTSPRIIIPAMKFMLN